MPDEVQKTFVRSFIVFLKKEVDSQKLTPDAQESVEVAMQCLQAAFDVGEDVDESQAADTSGTTMQASASTSTVDAKEIDLFELFQSLYIERNPESLQMAEAIKNEGNRLMKEGKYNEALLQYNRAITFDPKNPIFYCNRAAAYIRLGDNERAVTDCKSALVYNPNYGKAFGRLGIAYSNLGKYAEAQQAYEKAIELEPDNQDYRNNLEVARNANEPSLNAIPQLTEGLHAMLSNPAVRNYFSSADLDLETLHSVSQNPMIMNVMRELLSGIGQGGGGMRGSGGVPPVPNDVLQLFQSFASQLSGSMGAQNQGQNNSGGNGNGSGSDPSNPQQPPPST